MSREPRERREREIMPSIMEQSLVTRRMHSNRTNNSLLLFEQMLTQTWHSRSVPHRHAQKYLCALFWRFISKHPPTSQVIWKISESSDNLWQFDMLGILNYLWLKNPCKISELKQNTFRNNKAAHTLLWPIFLNILLPYGLFCFINCLGSPRIIFLHVREF